MEIAPNTNIQILRNVPLDDTYEHTIFFRDSSEQSAYFSTFVKYNLTQQKYQRVNKGTMNIQVVSENLYDCNYLRFQNASFGTKWFYAFIQSVEYVNNDTSRITYVLDEMQTWFFDYELKQCFVERETASDDTVGSNLVPEALDLGEYQYSNGVYNGTTYIGNYGHDSNFNDWAIVVASTQYMTLGSAGGVPAIELHDAEGDIYGNLYSGIHYNVFPSSEYPLPYPSAATPFYTTKQQLANAFIKASSESGGQGIVAVFMIPTSLVKNPGTTAINSYAKYLAKPTYNGEYYPRNKKLLTYPYNFIAVSDNNGRIAQYNYEYFNDSSCQLMIQGSMSCNPEIQVVPQNYKGLGSAYNEKFSFTDLPQCPYNIDVFIEWLANQGIPAILGAGANIGSGDLRAYKHNYSSSTRSQVPAPSDIPGYTGASIALQAINLLGEATPSLIQPPHAQGKITNTINIGTNQFGFTYYNAHLRPEFCRIIDDYFDRFGYATHRNKIPNRDVRLCWTYTKTINCTIEGSIPADSASKICSIYNNGITFWRYRGAANTRVGDYTQTNTIDIRS